MTGPGAGAEAEILVLRLFVTGTTPRSTAAVSNLNRILGARPTLRYRLDVVDIYQDPEKAAKGGVIAAPTLVRLLPEPVRRIIGDLSDEAKVLSSLGLPAA